MKRKLIPFLFFIFPYLIFAQSPSTPKSIFEIPDQEIIYGHRDGMALTMFVVRPEKSNGKAIISLVSSGFGSDIKWIDTYYNLAIPFTEKGYTVFLTLHSACPRYSIPDAFEDVQRAIQYVRYNSTKYKIDPDNIGITGSSSGGVLALLAATTNDIKKSICEDPIQKMSSKVQAVAVFYPGTDFLNFGGEGKNILNQTDWLQREQLSDAFKYTILDTATNTYQTITDIDEIRKITTQISPAQLVSPDDAPACIIHGDQDNVVPLQQSQIFKDKMGKNNLPVSLMVKKNAGHGWKNQVADEEIFVSWFNKYLKVKKIN